MKKKREWHSPDGENRKLNLSLKKMKLTLIFTMLVFLSFGKGFSQVNVTLQFEKTTIQELMETLEKQTGYVFLYKDEIFDPYKNYSVDFSNEPFENVLKSICESAGVDYEIRSNRQIILTEKDKTTGEAGIKVLQQERTVTGVVADRNGQPLPGVTVVVKGTTIGTVTNSVGEFSLAVPIPAQVLQFSFVGMQTQEVSMEGKTMFTVVMEEEVLGIEEVVAIGYSTVKKVSLTSAVSAVKGEDLTKRTVSNVQQALQGQLPGLMVIDRGAGPGRSDMLLRVRGTTTIGNNEPLVIVNGIEQALADINPDDIESVTVLKDASSTSIYGSRAANGVILITTKKPQLGRITGTFHSYYALQKSNNLPEQIGLEDFFRMQNIAYINSTGSPYYSEEFIQEYLNTTDRLKYPLPFNWYDAVLQTAPQISNNLSITGGAEHFNARLSIRNLIQDGIIPNTESNINEIRLDTEFKISEKITVGLNANYRIKNYLQPYNEYNVWRYVLRSPFAVPRYPDGTYGIGKDGHSPLVYAELEGTLDQVNTVFVSEFHGSWEIMEGLRFSTQYAYYEYRYDAESHRNAYEVRDYYNPDIVRRRQTLIELTETRNKREEITINNLLNYVKTIGNNDFSFLLGYSQTEQNLNNLDAYRRGFYNNDMRSLSAGADDGTKKNSGTKSSWGLRSYFGRFNYSLKNKYLFEANCRFDGSSRFTKSNRYSFFPSISAGWRIAQEEFWSGNQMLNDLVNELKIRGSWGKTGNQAIPLYAFYPAYTKQTYVFNDNLATAYAQTDMINTNLTWETTTQIDIGLDVGFLENKYYLNLDYYNKKTEGILLTLPIPGAIGLSPGPQNAGRVDNKGWELVIGTHNKLGDFSINSNINLNYNRNNVVDLAGTGPYIYSHPETGNIIKEGLPLYTLWGYKADGLFQTEEEIKNYPTRVPGTKPGDVKYLNLNNDDMIDSDDMTDLGQTVPIMNFGSNLNLSYKGFSLDLLFQGVAGVKTTIGGPVYQMGAWDGFIHKIFTNNYWTPENPDAEFPRPLRNDTRNEEMSSFRLWDGSYLRLKNVQLKYQIPNFIPERIGLKQIGIYISGTNLITFSNLNRWNIDPETVLGGRIEAYPQTSLYTIGISIGF